MQVGFAQSQQDDLAITLGATTFPKFGDTGIGFDLSARYYLTDAFSLGGNFYTASPKFNHGFGYETDRTLLNIYAINVPLEYDVINTEKFTLGLGFSNGLLLNVLRNRNKTKEVTYYDDDTGIWYTSQVPVRIKTDVYYLLTPFADASLKILTLEKQDASMFLTAKASYQNAFGNGAFSRPNDFRSYMFSVGITIKGSTK